MFLLGLLSDFTACFTDPNRRFSAHRGSGRLVNANGPCLPLLHADEDPGCIQ